MKCYEYNTRGCIQPYSQQFISYLNYKWSNKLECYIALGWKRPAYDKVSSLEGPFLSYKENEVLII
jgi:hypothetical protein